MARRKTYDISEEKYLKAIEWLDNKGTKKGACEILGVSNNKTMENLIAEFEERKSRDRVMRAKKRGTAVTDSELVQIITDYINGYSLQELSDRYYRSAGVIKHQLEKHGAALRHFGTIDPLNPPLLPEECLSDTFEIGQYVWSSKYNCIAQVKALYKNAYRIQVLGNGLQEQAYQPAYELGNLEHLEKLGVKLSAFEDYMDGEEVKYQINKTMLEANKRYKKENK